MGEHSRVVIGMDPHKRSVTVEVMVADETIVGHGRFGTDVAGFAQLVGFAAQWPDRVWAIEGCEGSDGTWPNASSPLVSRWWMCRRSCRRGCACSPPARAARPTTLTPTRSPWSGPDRRPSSSRR